MDGMPITIVITRRVRSGCEAAIDRELRAWIPQSIDHPGHQGVLLLHPSEGGNEFGAVLRFRSAADWRSFQQTTQYQSFLRRVGQLLEDTPRVEEVTGLEAWFQSSASKMHGGERLKMALVTWIGVCITVGLLGTYLGPRLAEWPWFVRLLVMNAAVVGALTWVVMPPLIRLAQFLRFLRPPRTRSDP